MSAPRSKPRIVASWDPEGPRRQEPSSAFFVPETRMLSQRPSAAFGQSVRYATKIRVPRIPPEGQRARSAAVSYNPLMRATRGSQKVLAGARCLLLSGFALWGIGGGVLWLLDESVLAGYVVPLKATPFLAAPVLAAAIAARRALRRMPLPAGPHPAARLCAGLAIGLASTSLVLSAAGWVFLHTNAFAEFGAPAGFLTARLILDASAVAILLAGASASLVLWAFLLLSSDRLRRLSGLLACLPLLLAGWLMVRETLEYLLARLMLDPWGMLMLASELRSYSLPLFIAAGVGLVVVLVLPATVRRSVQPGQLRAEPWTAEVESMRTW